MDVFLRSASNRSCSFGSCRQATLLKFCLPEFTVTSFSPDLEVSALTVKNSLQEVLTIHLLLPTLSLIQIIVTILSSHHQIKTDFTVSRCLYFFVRPLYWKEQLFINYCQQAIRTSCKQFLTKI